MPDTPEKARGSKVEFIQNHQPALPMGNYQIKVEQAIAARSPSEIISETFPAATLQFAVLGSRFTLGPQEIQAVFPPAGSLGDHANALPHIILKRSTLPWERSPDRATRTVPWLALLLFDEDELRTSVTTQSIKLATLKQRDPHFPVQFPQLIPSGGTPPANAPYWQQELGDQDDDTVTVIDVAPALLRAIIPTKADLEFLAHVRQTQDATGKPMGDEVAVIIGNRLPKSGGMNTVHLVVLEGRYSQTDGQFFLSGEDRVRLVSLTSWRFACVDRQQNFKTLLMHLNHQLLFSIEDNGIRSELNRGQVLNTDLKQAFAKSHHPLAASVRVDRVRWKIADDTRLFLISNMLNVYNQAGKYLFHLGNVTPTDSIDAALQRKFTESAHSLSKRAAIAELDDSQRSYWWINTYQYVLIHDAQRLSVYHLDPDSSSTLRFPPLETTDQATRKAAEAYFNMGCVPLSHTLRQGSQTVSWYHGPLVPGRNVTAEDGLPVRSADDLVRYNPTYDMLDVSYAAAWELGRLLALQSKSFSVSLYHWKRTHAQRIKDAEYPIDHLPLNGPDPSLTRDLPQVVTDWLRNLSLLEGVPFNYLVPDERLLPPESIRFFQLDPLWMACLRDGALSMGRVLAADHARDTRTLLVPPGVPERISGFLLRSDVVAGWPGLLVDGYDVTAPEQQGDRQSKRSLLRMATLSKNVLICLFDGLIRAVDLHLKPETLHFGVDTDAQNNGWIKKLRDPHGNDTHLTVSIPPKQTSVNGAVTELESSTPISQTTTTNRVIHIQQLADSINQALKQESQGFAEFTSAEFALEMIEGVDSVRFVSGSDGA